jgi:dTDP-4-dehydrorhamnose 3,5-epimerase
MHIHETDIPDVKRITLDIFRDARGFFCERYHQEKFAALGFHENFVQDNHSRSMPGTIRGLHFQHTPKQGKLVGVTHGRVLDVAVDIRPNSPSFGKHVSVELSSENGELLWIPAGFAHGFCVLGDGVADVFYKVNALYSAQGESGIRFDDPALGIDWPIKQQVISDRDRALPTLGELKPKLAQWFA